MNNEKGSSLLVVLLTITLISIFSVTMIASSINARTQIIQTEKVNRALDLAEMGITHYKSLVDEAVLIASQQARTQTDSYVSSANSKSNNNGNGNGNNNNTALSQESVNRYFNERFCENLKSNNLFKAVSPNPFSPVSVESSSYQYQVVSFSGSCVNDAQLTLQFISSGEDQGLTEIVNGIIFISKYAASPVVGRSAATVSVDNLPDFEITEDNVVTIKGNRSFEYTQSVEFNKNVTLSGNTTLLIKGNALFKMVERQNGNNFLHVLGDAYFYTDPVINGKPNDICVEGTAYKFNSESKQFEQFNVPNDSCPQYDVTVGWDTNQLPMDIFY